MDAQDQFSIVQDWLQSFYTETGVPEFEINPETISALYDLATLSQRNTSNANLVLEDSKEQLESYKSMSAELTSIISSIGLPIPQESSKMKSSGSFSIGDPEKQLLTELILLSTSLATTLGLVKTDASAMMEALGDLDVKLFSMESEEQGLAERKMQLNSMYKETSEMRQVLQRVASTWDQQLEANLSTNQERVQTLKYLDSKSKEYTATLQTLKETLRRNGANQNIYHGTLQQLHDQLLALESQNNDKQAQLEGFKQLPPDASLAKLKIAEAAEYLLQLEETISRRVSKMQINTDL